MSKEQDQQTLGQFLGWVRRRPGLSPGVEGMVVRVVRQYKQGALLVEPHLSDARQAVKDGRVRSLRNALVFGRSGGGASRRNKDEKGSSRGCVRKFGGKRKPGVTAYRPIITDYGILPR